MKDYTQVERDNAAFTIRDYAFGQMNMLRMLGDEDAANNLQQAINVAIDVLRGSQPDPETGLVPCGCGGKATRSYSSIGCVVFCSTCGCTTKSVFFASEAVKVWNTAMGWKGGAE